MAIHIANMALRLTKKTTIYTNGDDSVAEGVRVALVKPTEKISVDSRKILEAVARVE